MVERQITDNNSNRSSTYWEQQERYKNDTRTASMYVLNAHTSKTTGTTITTNLTTTETNTNIKETAVVLLNEIGTVSHKNVVDC